MDMNEYALEILVRDRLAEAWAQAERRRQILAARPTSRPMRVTLGQALIRLGHHLQDGQGPPPRRGRDETVASIPVP